MTKESLKDHLDGKELDLSMGDLTKVPVKELAALPKATFLDLSCNHLTGLPDNFATLTHLVKLDLSKNRITSLPENIGQLTKLQHLDLLGNQLENLPLNFGKLRSLRWLDLKDNDNLDGELKRIAGDCLDDRQCIECAKRVLSHIGSIQREMDDHTQKKLQKQQKQAAKRQAEKERRLEAVRKERQEQKQLERQKKTEEYEVAQAAKKRREEKKERKNAAKVAQKLNGIHENPPIDKKSGSSCLVVFITLLVAVVACCVGIYFVCESHDTNSLCIDLSREIRTIFETTKAWTDQLRDKMAA